MRRWIVTFLGTGYAPVAPGTFGSAAALAVAMIAYAVLWQFNAFTPAIWNAALALGIVLAAAGCVLNGPFAVAHFGRPDPPPVVIDEVAGVFLTLLFVPVKGGPDTWLAFAVAFIAFRIFDVWKPPPCGKLENLPAGWGILADDLMAAVYANLACQLVVRFVL